MYLMRVSGIVDGEFNFLTHCVDAVMFRVYTDEENCGSGVIDFWHPSYLLKSS